MFTPPRPDCEECLGTGRSVVYGDHDKLIWVPCSCTITGEAVKIYAPANTAAARYEEGSAYRPLSHGGWFIDENGETY